VGLARSRRFFPGCFPTPSRTTSGRDPASEAGTVACGDSAARRLLRVSHHLHFERLFIYIIDAAPGRADSEPRILRIVSLPSAAPRRQSSFVCAFAHLFAHSRRRKRALPNGRTRGFMSEIYVRNLYRKSGRRELTRGRIEESVDVLLQLIERGLVDVDHVSGLEVVVGDIFVGF
jgi:hypothetical protein